MRRALSVSVTLRRRPYHRSIRPSRSFPRGPMWLIYLWYAAPRIGATVIHGISLTFHEPHGQHGANRRRELRPCALDRLSEIGDNTADAVGWATRSVFLWPIPTARDRGWAALANLNGGLTGSYLLPFSLPCRSSTRLEFARFPQQGPSRRALRQSACDGQPDPTRIHDRTKRQPGMPVAPAVCGFGSGIARRGDRTHRPVVVFRRGSRGESIRRGTEIG